MLINTALKAAFEAKVEKLNKRANKLGQPPVLFSYGDTIESECGSITIARYRGKGNKWFALYTEVVIIGDAPKMAGWRFLATVDLTGSKALVRRQPWTAEAVDLSAYFHSTGFCQHCNKHRSRSSTLVVQNVESGELMEIGRNCAADFFRSTDASSIVGVWDSFSSMSDDEGEWEGHKHYQPIVGLDRLFEYTAAVVRKWGFVKPEEAQRDTQLTPTRSRVRTNLFPSAYTPKDELVDPGAGDEAEAAAIIAWLDSDWLSIIARTEFQLSVQAAVEVSKDGWRYVAAKNMNYLIWMVNGYKADLEKKAVIATEKAGAGASNFVGSPGARVELSVTLKFRRSFGTQFGTSYLCKMIDEAGNTITTFGSGDAVQRMKLDHAYRIKGTVKDHKLYEGAKQTELSRVAVLVGELADLA